MLALGGGDEEAKKAAAPKLTAEQMRLNPMAGMDKALDVVKTQGKNVNHATKATLAKINKQNSIKKQDLSSEFRQKSFMDSRDKIMNLSKKSGLRQLNALEIARELRKKLRS